MIMVFGCMIGAYIFTRMLELLIKKQESRWGGLIKVFAIITMLVAAAGIGYFILNEMSNLPGLNYLKNYLPK
jgi:hypothetical protein